MSAFNCQIDSHIAIAIGYAKLFSGKGLPNSSYTVHTINMIRGRNIVMTRFSILWSRKLCIFFKQSCISFGERVYVLEIDCIDPPL